MITQYFEVNQRLIIQAPGTLAPATSTNWVYGDNYNLAIYLISQGAFLAINPGDTLGLLLFSPGGPLPEANLAIISAPIVLTDSAGYQYFSVNVNLKTTGLASLVQTPNQPAKTNFHYTFSPSDGERFSSSADVAITVVPDPAESATGATPVPPGYPADSSVFEQKANKGTANGYAQLDATGKVPIAELPTVTGGDMTKAVYDKDNNGIVDTCDSVQSSRVIGLGTAATLNVPATGNATSAQVVLGSDTRLADSRVPTPHAVSHLVGAADQIQLATTGAAGLCPPPDGSTVQIVGGKLTATTSGSGDMLKSVYDTNNDGIVDNAAAVSTHIVPPSGNATATQIVLGSDSRLSDIRTPSPHASTHNGGSDAIPLASASAQGLCPAVDGTTIQVAASKLSAILASSSAPGIVRPDNSSITVSGGIISATPGAFNRAKAYLVAALNVAASSDTFITLDTVEFDTGGYYSTSNGRFTIPSADNNGIFEIGFQLGFASGASPTGYRLAYMCLNGNFAQPIAADSKNPINGAHGYDWLKGTIIRKCATGEYFQLYGYQTTSAALALVNGSVAATTSAWIRRVA